VRSSPDPDRLPATGTVEHTCPRGWRASGPRGDPLLVARRRTATPIPKSVIPRLQQGLIPSSRRRTDQELPIACTLSPPASESLWPESLVQRAATNDPNPTRPSIGEQADPRLEGREAESLLHDWGMYRSSAKNRVPISGTAARMSERTLCAAARTVSRVLALRRSMKGKLLDQAPRALLTAR